MEENHMVIGERYDGHWDCSCDASKPNDKCSNCVINDLDYFEED